MKIKVTKRDFHEANQLVRREHRSISRNCPIAVAIKRMGASDVEVGTQSILIDGNLLTNLPREVWEIEDLFAKQEYGDLSILPIEFEIK